MPDATEKPAKLPSAFIAYGGARAIFKSCYFWTSAALMAPTFPLWSKADWWDTVLSIIPNLLGFSLGGFALVTALGDQRFKELVIKAKSESGVSVHHSMAGTFLFFIAIQTIALLSALACKGLWAGSIPDSLHCLAPFLEKLGWVVWPLSYLTFLYAITMIYAASKWIYMLLVAYERHMTVRPKEPEKKGPES